MKSLLKKSLTALVLLAVVLDAAPAQGKAEQGPVKETVISLATADNTYGISTDPELQDSVSQLIKEKTGYTINPIISPLASYSDKVTTLVNSGDAPDIFIVAQAMVKIPQMAARGQLLDLTGYIKNSKALSVIDPELFKTPYVDGKIYFVPYNYPKSKGIYIRKDIMDKYGIKLSQAPTTEEFRTEMKKLVGSGITPFTFPKWIDNFQFFFNSFGAWGGVCKVDGKYFDGFQTPEMEEALTYLHQLYEDGILNKEFITTENNQMREKTYTAQTASDIDYITNYINYVQQTIAAKKPTEVQLIYKLVGPRGDGGTLNEATQTAWLVSSKTKNPDAAFKVIETIVTDPVLYPAFYGIGVEGKHYTLDANGKITPTAKAQNSGYKYTLNYLSDSFLDINLSKLSFKLDDTLIKGINQQRACIKESAKYLGPNHSADVPVGVSEAYDRVAPSIKSTRESIVSKVVIGNLTVKEGMAEYQNFWKSIGGPKILEELNASLAK